MPVLAGSHMDSRPAGGRFDDIFGVLAALAALEAPDDAGIATVRPIDLVAWTNGEVGRFAPLPGRHPWPKPARRRLASFD
jgi:N-carbamoyl-L-amino-acid hydrolase